MFLKTVDTNKIDDTFVLFSFNSYSKQFANLKII